MERGKVGLALQGGGSHGAFTWGVLDRLLEDKTLEFIGVTGTSAGAMNAILLADGLVRGGPEEARRRLSTFWEKIGAMPGFAALLWGMSGESAATMHLEQTPPYLAWDAMSRNLSPYDLNPSNFNPMRAPLEELVDFDRLRAQEDFQVFVCATNARTSVRRVFNNKDMSVDAVLASACLPQMFPAVKIEGEPYWDGGFTGNPAMVPLLRKMPKSDLIIVRIDPINRPGAPRSVREIHDRILEISFNSTYWLELAILAVILRFVDEGHLDRERFGRILFHCIEASSIMEKFPASSKLNNYSKLLDYLFDIGRQTANTWLECNAAAIGERSTLDLQKLLPAAVWDHEVPA